MTRPPPFPSALDANDGNVRIDSRRPPLHRCEAALVGVTALHLCFLPWALGSMEAWSQLMSLGFSIVGFLVATVPRSEVRHSLLQPSVHSPAAKLLRFPLFWAGLVLLSYIAIQGFNPAWRFVRDAESWWLEPLDHVTWLPSGVDAPYERFNPWRSLTIGTSLWLQVCSMWAGFSRRRSYQALFTLLIGSAFLLALLGVAQKLAGAENIFWFYHPSNDHFLSSFIYQNHAGAYFNLMVALTVGMALREYRRVQRGVGNIAGARILTFLAVLIGATVALSYSRMSIALLLGFATLVGGALAFQQRRKKGRVRHRDEFLPLALFFAGILGASLVLPKSEKIVERFSGLSAHPSDLDHYRTLARKAATEMLRDRWLLGWGAGCFRYGFPIYAQNYPEIYTSPGGARKYWEHAHDDLLEFPLELGAVGMLPLAFMFGYGAWQLGRHRFWRNVVSLSIVLGCVLVVLHAWVDFVFQNPAVLFTWSVFFVAAARWAELDQTKGADLNDTRRRVAIQSAGPAG